MTPEPKRPPPLYVIFDADSGNWYGCGGDDVTFWQTEKQAQDWLDDVCEEGQGLRVCKLVEASIQVMETSE